jgi:hypothetical protein
LIDGMQETYKWVYDQVWINLSELPAESFS